MLCPEPMAGTTYPCSMFTVFFIPYYSDNLQEGINYPGEEFVKSHVKPWVTGNQICVRVLMGEWVAWSHRVCFSGVS